jgi:small-conductance mechanosensitive channel
MCRSVVSCDIDFVYSWRKDLSWKFISNVYWETKAQDNWLWNTISSHFITDTWTILFYLSEKLRIATWSYEPKHLVQTMENFDLYDWSLFDVVLWNLSKRTNGSVMVLMFSIRNTTTNFDQDTRCPDQDVNLAPCGYKKTILTTLANFFSAIKIWLIIIIIIIIIIITYGIINCLF